MPTIRTVPHAAAAALALAAWAQPAQASSTALPGTMCTSDGIVERPTAGALLNKVSGASNTTTKFHCPIVRTEAVSAYGNTVTVKLSVRMNWSLATFDCALRATGATGLVSDSTSVVMPPKTSSNNGFWTSTFSVTLPPLSNDTLNLRCNVPNLYSGESAGIMGYRIEE